MGAAFHVGRAAQADGPLPGLLNSAGAWADIDNDGRMDLLLMGATTEETITRLYRNNGDGTFHDVGANFWPVAQGFAIWGDYDNDGDLDLAIAGQDYLGQPSAKIYRNDGNNTFTDIHAALIGDLPVYMSWVDFDHDGDLDLYLAGQGVARLYRNDAATFVPQRTYPSLGTGVWGDFDGDGMQDLFGSGLTYLHRGNGKFEVLTSAFLPSLGSATTDDDGDGRLDVLAGDTILRNQGTGEFLPEPQNSLPSSWVARWGDYDRDGVSDLLLAISEPWPPTIEVHRRTSTGWQKIVGFPGIDYAGVSCVDWVDIDNDGDLDIFYTGISNSQVTGFVSGFYTNTAPHSDAKPGPPLRLLTKETFVHGANGVLLSWEAPTNSSGRLSYNLRVGFQSRAGDVVPSHSDPATGRRLLYAPGNAGFQTNHLLRPRRAGTYHWSVQAIANDFSASTFSEEMTFTITNSPPSISDFSDRMMVANSLLGPIPFAIADGESPESALTLSVTSSDTNLIPNESIHFMVGPNGRTLSAQPVRFQTGTTTLSVRVTDPEGAFAESYFDVTVQPLFVLTDETIPASALPFGGWGDFDHDGDLDLLLGGGPLAIYRNDGHAGLANTGVPIIGEWEGTPRTLGRGAVAWSDADNDGDLDLLAIGQTSGNPANVTDIFQNNGDGTFSAVNAGLPLLSGNPFGSWADFDCDGRMDVLVGGQLSQVGFVARLFRNNGQGSYTFFGELPKSPDAIVVIRPTAAWMDFDNDGDPDLLTCGAGRSQLLRNDGFGGFVDTGMVLPSLTGTAIAWGDYDQDGWPDFVITGTLNRSATGARTLLYRNNRNGTFSLVDTPLAAIYSGAVAWADYDNDGYPDLLLSGTTLNNTVVTRLYHNDGGLTFVDAQAGFPGISQGMCVWADVDQDGDLDLFLAGTSASGTYSGVFSNRLATTNARPTPPTSLSTVLLPDNAVQLTWQPGSDLETASPALTYDIRVGTTSGGIDVVSPPAEINSGARQVAEPGKARRVSRLSDLPKGEYFWSVQTVDSVFAGSIFSAEARFSITNARPTISALSNTQTVPNTVTPDITFVAHDVETPPDNLTFSATSSDSRIVPVNNIFVGGTGSNRFVRVLPTNGLAGTVNLTITVTDSDGGQRSRPLSVRVNAFAETSAVLPNSINASASWADFDNDGDLDLLLAGANKVALYRNDGGFFAEKTLDLPGVGYESTFWGDMDRDGYLDILYVGESQSKILQGRGDGTFLDRQPLLPGHSQSGPYASAWVDYDNDGDLDVALGRRLFRNDGVSVPSEGTPIIPGGRWAAWDDFDNDGDMDLAVYSFQFSATRVYRNEGNGNFVDIGFSFPAGARPLAWGDYDNDGNVDLLLGIESGDIARLFRNQGDGTFSEVPVGLPSSGRSTVAWADYDNDGRLDILLAGSPGGSPTPPMIYHNNRNGTFSDSEIVLPAVTQGYSAWGDYDNDGRVDLLLGGQVHLMRNFLGAQSSALVAPTNLNSQVSSGGAVTLRWFPTGTEPAAEHSFHRYNLRVGTTPGGSEVMSAASDPVTGHRRLANFGNVGSTNFWRLYLHPGYYYWSVQAIGPNLAASPFAEEATFAVVAPIITDFAVLADSKFRCHFKGATGLSYSVFGSLDLVTWSSLGAAQEVAPGIFEFVDGSTLMDSRFYQIRSP